MLLDAHNRQHQESLLAAFHHSPGAQLKDHTNKDVTQEYQGV